MALDSNVELLSGSWSEEVRAESTGGLEQVTARAHAGEGARARIPPLPKRMDDHPLIYRLHV
jgi:hypothetical protein